MVKKTGLASISKGSSDIFKIDPRELHIKDNWNSRDWSLQENIDHIEMLSLSIAEKGVIQPLTVKWENGKAWVDDGECRYKATMLAIGRGVDIQTVPCRAADQFANEEERRFNRYLANTGKQFNQLEMAKDFKWFLDHGYQQTDIAKKAGLTPGRVSQILSVLTLPQAAIAMIGNGQVSASLATQVVKASASPTQAEATLKAGLEAAKADGSNKIKPTHMQGDVKLSIKAAVKEAFEYCDIDDSDSKIIVIKMPFEHWEVIRKMCEL